MHMTVCLSFIIYNSYSLIIKSQVMCECLLCLCCICVYVYVIYIYILCVVSYV